MVSVDKIKRIFLELYAIDFMTIEIVGFVELIRNDCSLYNLIVAIIAIGGSAFLFYLFLWIDS